MSAEAIRIQIGAGVYIRASLQQARAQRVELNSAQMCRADTPRQDVKATEGSVSVARLRAIYKEPAKRGLIVEKNGFKERIADGGPGVQHDLQAFGKSRRSEVHLDQTVDWPLALDRIGWADSSGEQLSNAIGRVDFEFSQQIGASGHG